MHFRATYTVPASTVTVDMVVPEQIIEEFTDEDGTVDTDGIEEWVADRSHPIASEHIETWGIHLPVRLDMSLDGIGADTVERVVEEG